MVMREYDFEALPQATRVKDVYRRALSDGQRPIIIDCGGHIGMSAVWFASHFPQATIYCIEPNAANFAILQQNVAPYPNITALNGGVWGKHCNLKISNPDSGSASFRLQETAGASPSDSGPSDSLPSYTIDEIRLGAVPNPLLIVKIDIEGAEASVFAEPVDWLAHCGLLIIELHDWLLPGEGTSKNLFKRIGENDVDVILQGENLLLFKNVVRNAAVNESLPADAVLSRP